MLLDMILGQRRQSQINNTTDMEDDTSIDPRIKNQKQITRSSVRHTDRRVAIYI